MIDGTTGSLSSRYYVQVDPCGHCFCRLNTAGSKHCCKCGQSEQLRITFSSWPDEDQKRLNNLEARVADLERRLNKS